MGNSENKQLIALTVTFIIFVIVAVLVYFFIFNKGEDADDRVPIEISETVKSKLLAGINGEKIIKYADPVVIIPREMTEQDVEKFVTSFVERYGSYSNQANFDNIMILEASMTDRMKTWAKGYVNDQRAKKKSNIIYYGVITKAVGVDVEEFDNEEGQASFLVKTRRKESFISKNGSDNVFNQDIKIKVVKIGKVWKVDEAFWQDR